MAGEVETTTFVYRATGRVLAQNQGTPDRQAAIRRKKWCGGAHAELQGPVKECPLAVH